jgi:hypothetical protein
MLKISPKKNIFKRFFFLVKESMKSLKNILFVKISKLKN